MKTFVKIVLFLSFTTAFGQPPCGTNPPAGNTCATATPICELNGYCGNTSASYTANSWSQSCGFLGLSDCGLSGEFCGSIENNSFLTFTASASSISFDVWVFNSTNGDGIQIMIFSANNCSGTVTSYYCSELAPAAGSQTVSASGLTPGNTYYIMIDGFAGDVCDYIFAANTGVSIPVDVTPASSTICSGQSVSLTATGGNGTFTWNASPDLSSTSGTTVTATPPTAPGTYTYTVNSATGNPLCPSSTTATATINVTSCGSSCSITASNSGDVCEGTSTFNLNATPVSGATYSWSGPAGFSSTSQNPTGVTLPTLPGTYSYTVTANDGSTCSATTTVTIFPTPTITASATSLCAGSTVSLTGSGMPASANPWSSSSSGVASIDNSGTLTANSLGSTTITYLDNHSCTNSLLIDVIATPIASISGTTTICSGEDAVVDFTGTPNATVEYQINGGATQTLVLDGTGQGSLNTGSLVNNTTYNLQTVQINPPSGCSNNLSGSAVITVGPPPTMQQLPDIQVCQGDMVEVSTFVTNPVGATVHWTNDNVAIGLGASGVGTISSFPGVGVGMSSISLTPSLNGCVGTAMSFDILVSPQPTADFAIYPNQLSIMDPTFSTLNHSVNATSYQWNVSDGFNSNATSITHTLPEQPGVYSIVLYASNGACIDSFQVSIEVLDELIIYVPNTFTPDGDEYNNVFVPIINTAYDYQNYMFEIFNRWGELIFESHDPHFGWDGTYHDFMCKEGQYIWRIEVKQKDKDKHFVYTGHVNLIR